MGRGRASRPSGRQRGVLSSPQAPSGTSVPDGPRAFSNPTPSSTGARYRSLTGRATLALGFLLGFYVLAFGSVVALVGANVALFALTGRTQFHLLMVTLFVTWAVVRGVFFLDGHDVTDLAGVEVDDRAQPELLKLVSTVATEMCTIPPARVLLVPEVNASVTQTGGMMGLRAGERVMTIGVGLLDCLTVDQLRAVLAHELGHYAGGDTRLGPLVYRAGTSIYRTVDHLGGDSLLGRLFAAYGRRYLGLSQRVRRHQELWADAAAVRLAGRDSLVSALGRIAASGAAFGYFVGTYLAPLWRRGLEPDNAFEGYRTLLADTRRQELPRVEEALHDPPTDPYDSHPSLAERISQATALPDRPEAGRDTRPARHILTDADETERQVSRLLTQQAMDRQMERVVSWEAAAEVFGADVAESADALLWAAAEVAGDANAATLQTVISLLEGGRSRELAAALTGPLDHLPQDRRDDVYSSALRHYLGCALGAYLARRGHAWSVSWSGPIRVVDDKGEPTDPFTLAASLLENGAQGSQVRELLGEPSQLSRFRAQPRSDDAHKEAPELVGVVPDVKFGGKRADLVVTSADLVFHPIAQTAGYRWRLLLDGQGLAAPTRRAAKQRLGQLFSRSEEEVLGGGAGADVVALSRLRRYRRRFLVSIDVDLSSDTGERTLRILCPDQLSRDNLLAWLEGLLTNADEGSAAGTSQGWWRQRLGPSSPFATVSALPRPRSQRSRSPRSSLTGGRNGGRRSPRSHRL